MVGLNFLLTGSAAGAMARIGPESLLSLPSSALWQGFVGNTPADGSLQNLNPPLFKWTYMEDPTQSDKNVTRAFRFQLSTNPNFSSFVWNILTSNNFYNFLPPITNSDGSIHTGTNYWRVIYLNSDATVNLATGAMHHFSLAANATNWDRSMLGDPNYLISVGQQHPHMYFFATNRDAVSQFVRTSVWPSTAFGWVNQTNYAFQVIAQSWWNSPTIANENLGNRLLDVALVAWVYQLDRKSVV